VVLNYRYATAAAAQAVPRRDVTLMQCRDCGLIFNATFDPGLIPYDERYENRQCFSPAFVDHLGGLAAGLRRRARLDGGRVLEVGCGKGDFLRQICTVAGADGIGYDTSYEGPARRRVGAGNSIRFYRRYVAPADIHPPFQLVLCRHVVEHVPAIGVFLGDLAAMARAAGDPLVVIETPRWEWIAQHRCLWDVFYEHCNYFTMATLAALAVAAGFRVVRQQPVFGGQYQLLELRLARRQSKGRQPVAVPAGLSLTRFGTATKRVLRSVAVKVTRAAGDRPWAIWGAGAKGVALVNQWPGIPPALVIDSNAAKQGCFIPGSAIPIVAPTDPRLADIAAILVANPNYFPEISQTLQRRNWSGHLLKL